MPVLNPNLGKLIPLDGHISASLAVRQNPFRLRGTDREHRVKVCVLAPLSIGINRINRGFRNDPAVAYSDIKPKKSFIVARSGASTP